MKKKGFTLIELLAVIVILAIIALIATPLVLKYIEKSRKESKVDSAYSFVRNLETEIANYSIKHNGKKYNGQPSDKGYYELSSFKDSEIDTTVKGDKPNSVKVCLSSLGQVEKAMFEYGKYYVSYDGKKGSISDSDTYSSFTCSSNIGGGTDIASTYIIDEDLEFVYDESMRGYVATLPITSDIADKFEMAMDYDFIIDNGEIDTVASLNFYYGFGLGNYYTLSEIWKSVIIEDDKLVFMLSEEHTGKHNIKIGNPRAIEERTFFTIDNNNDITISGYDLVYGEAKVLIKDETGFEYYNDTINLIENGGDGVIGVDTFAGCRENLPDLPEVVTALKNGKTITVQVTQIVDDNEVISTVSKNLSTMFEVIPGEIYYSSSHPLALAGASGC